MCCTSAALFDLTYSGVSVDAATMFLIAPDLGIIFCLCSPCAFVPRSVGDGKERALGWEEREGVGWKWNAPSTESTMFLLLSRCNLRSRVFF